MPLFVCVTERCASEAARQGRLAEVKKLAEKLEKEQRCLILDRFLPTPFVKRSFGKSHRLLGREYDFGEHQVVCFLRFYARGDREYEEWLDRREDAKYRETLAVQALAGLDLRSWLADELKKRTVLPEVHPPPDAPEMEWLTAHLTADTGVAQDVVVLESKRWVQRILGADVREYTALIHQILANVIDAPKAGAQSFWDDKAGGGIVYRFFPGLQRLFLATVLTPKDRALEDRQAREAYARMMGAPEGEVSTLDLLKSSARSYPAFIVYSREDWLEVQKDTEANLALSPEESEVLASVQSEKSEATFPLFVNGRAGSGKSTILQYLIRDYIRLAAKQRREGGQLVPLYLTCSPELLEVATKRVERLALTHADALGTRRTGAEDRAREEADVRAIVGESLEVFHVFARKLLDGRRPDAAKRFSRGRHVSYSVFLRLWKEKLHRRPATRPDVAWHVIRTYIKGMAPVPGEWFDPQDYKELSRRQHTVTQETFQSVFKEIFEGWYLGLCAEDGWWDDQDLVLEVLALDEFPSTYPAIFCDEAQDFTRVELELLFRLCLFSRRTMHPHLLRRIPVAFVGDPFQTLNPTGFRWDAVQAAFHEKFVQSLDPFGRSGLKFNFRELRSNYRSSQSIARFCNILLLLRSTLFNLRDVGPQEAWQLEGDSPLPAFFDSANHEVQEVLKKQPDQVIIVNCEEGGESQFVEKDRILKGIVRLDESGVPRNVMSPIRAKGLEFSRVVLYGFGDSCPEEFVRVTSRGAERDSKPDDDLPAEYFLNRLYVAVSRPKRRLFIMDSKESLNGFWSFARNPDFIRDLITRSGHGGAGWEPDRDFCYMEEGTLESLTSETDDPRQRAQQLEGHGRAKGDPYLLRQARLIYESTGNPTRARLLLAEALAMEGKYAEAAANYADLDKPVNAQDCLWIGGLFKDLVELTNRFPALGESFQHRASLFMSGGKGTEQGKKLLARLESVYDSNGAQIPVSLADRTWVDVVTALCETFANADEAELAPATRAKFARIVDHLLRSGTLKDSNALALILYRGDLSKEAVALWSRLERPSKGYPREYHIACARELPYPRNLEHLEYLGRHEAMVEEWRKKQQHGGLLEVDRQRIARALALGRHHAEAFQLLMTSKEEDFLAHVREHVGADPAVLPQAVPWLVRHRVEAKAWVEALELTREDGLRGLSKGVAAARSLVDDELKEMMRQARRAVLYLAATTDLLSKAGETSQSRVSSFLESTLGPISDSWRNADALVPLSMAGAAIERAGQIINAISFYEAATGRKTEEERYFLRRLLKCHEKRVEMLKRRGESEKIAAAERKRYEVSAATQTWLDPEEQIPEYPQVSEQVRKEISRKLGFEAAVREQAISDSVESWQWGDLTFQFSAKHKRLKIDHSSRFENAMFDIISGDAPKGGGEFAADPERMTGAGWISKSWGLRLEVTRRPTGVTLVIEAGTSRRELNVP